MSCERLHAALTDHACGAPLAEAAAAHLTACPECRARLDDERRLLAQVEAKLRHQLQVSPSPGFSVKVSRRARALPSARHAIAARWITAAASVVLALAVYSSISLERERAPALPAESDVNPMAHARAVPRDVALPATQPANGLSMPENRPARGPATRKPGGSSHPAAPSTLDVQVPPTQQLAIARLQELGHSGALREAALPAGDPLSSPPADLRIAPLTVPEIVIPDVAVVTGGADLSAQAASKESL